MRLRAKRDEERPPHPAARWRRQFFILAGAIAALGVLAWRFTGAEPGRHSGGTVAAARSAVAALRALNALPPAAYGSAPPGLPPPPKGGPSAAVAAGDAPCPPHDIVLSLSTSQSSYGPGVPLRFNVDAVSTAGECQMAYGPYTVRVIVTWHGHVEWDSAECGPAPAATVRFQPGVPRLLTITWNRAAASPAGCAGSLPATAAGTFEAVAISAGQSSPVAAFTLLR